MTVKIKVKEKLEDDTLDLSWCDLKDVPIREIVPIKKAAHLDLSNNQLVSIPRTIVSLTQIVKLDLSKNLLTEIPENIGEMRQLKYLDLYSNQISRLPLSMGDLKNLKWLDLKDNPLTAAVASVAGPCSNTAECQQCARKIVSYLTYIRQTIEEEKKKRNNALAAASVTAAGNKKESKKKKKNKNNAKDEKKDDRDGAKGEDLMSHEHSRIHSGGENDMKHCESSSSSKSICSSICRLIYSTITFIILLGILIIFMAILLPRFNQPLSERVMTYLELQTNLPVQEYQKFGIEKFNSSSEIAIGFLNRIKAFVTHTFAKIIGEQHKCCGN